jgi:hypothetical protein
MTCHLLNSTLSRTPTHPTFKSVRWAHHFPCSIPLTHYLLFASRHLMRVPLLLCPSYHQHSVGTFPPSITHHMYRLQTSSLQCHKCPNYCLIRLLSSELEPIPARCCGLMVSANQLVKALRVVFTMTSLIQCHTRLSYCLKPPLLQIQTRKF